MTALDHFPPTRAEGLRKLATFVPKAGADYARRRNYDLGAGHHSHVSTLSPYIRRRILTECEVLQSVLARHSANAAEKLIQEVFWRTYWKGWLEMRPGVWTQYQSALRRQVDALLTQAGLRDMWQDACTGKTGIECFDNWADELVSTGYLHNHARMWFASIWIFTLRLPWELGADFFLRHLLDGDPASNTLSWRWVGGLQTVGKTYLARPDNIAKYTKGRFDPVTALASHAPALPALPAIDRQALAPELTVDAGLRTGFLLHSEDLSPGYVIDNAGGCCAQAVLRCDAALSPFELSPHVDAFLDAAISEACGRYDLGTPSTLTNLEALLAWVHEHQIEQVVTPYAPVGPNAEALNALGSTEPVRVVQVRRPYDSRAWPHATHGFFRFKDKISQLLEQL